MSSNPGGVLFLIKKSLVTCILLVTKRLLYFHLLISFYQLKHSPFNYRMQIYLENEVKYATQHIISIKFDTPLDFGMA